ncbi:TPA: AlpA family phage regulatory protein [Proteus mirabilis]
MSDIQLDKKTILHLYGYTTDRLVREKERKEITSISRSQAWKLEKENNFPKRKQLGNCSCGWMLSELLIWRHQR